MDGGCLAAGSQKPQEFSVRGEGEFRTWLHIIAEPVVDEFLAGQGGKLVEASVEGPLVNDYLHTTTFGQFSGFIKPERLTGLDIDVISPSWGPSCIFKGR